MRIVFVLLLLGLQPAGAGEVQPSLDVDDSNPLRVSIHDEKPAFDDMKQWAWTALVLGSPLIALAVAIVLSLVPEGRTFPNGRRPMSVGRWAAGSVLFFAPVILLLTARTVTDARSIAMLVEMMLLWWPILYWLFSIYIMIRVVRLYPNRDARTA